MARLHAERLIAECLEQFRCERDAGEPASPGEWRDRLGERHGEFLDALEVDAMLSEIVEPAPIRKSLRRYFGEYLLLEEVGGGAMGIVHEAVYQGQSALKALRAGDRIRWGFWPLDGEPGTAEFEVVDDPLRDFEALDGLGLWASRPRAEAVEAFDALPDAERRRGKGAGSPE
ncbi:MAG: hypothetical protein MUE73_06895 [Planctomycetes bacterium]|jgi:hypothetical protein|nr:hypothetical protein [Planctomycetota bacterium]